MTVRINKPALNLREELTKAQGVVRYEQRQFWMDGLVENGTFDNDLSGWINDTVGTGTVAWNAGTLETFRVDVTNRGAMWQPVNTTIGAKYLVYVAQSGTGSRFRVGSSLSGGEYVNENNIGTIDRTFTASTSTTYIFLDNYINGSTAVWDNIQVFEVDENDDVIHSVPLGFKPVHVYEDGLLQREGTNHDYTVVDTGFGYQVKPTVAPSATTETCVIAEREL